MQVKGYFNVSQIFTGQSWIIPVRYIYNTHKFIIYNIHGLLIYLYMHKNWIFTNLSETLKLSYLTGIKGMRR